MSMIRLLMICATLALAAPALAAPEPARTAVISAFAPELEALKAATTDRRETVIHGVVFTTGTLEGKPVVLFLSGVSMVNAAMTTQLALDHFPARRIVFSGVGGGAGAGLDGGDVVAPERWGEYQETAYSRATGDGFAPSPLGEAQPFPAFGMAIPRQVAVPKPGGGEEKRFWFAADPALLATARTGAARGGLAPCAATARLAQAPRIVVGGSGVSGPTFVDNAAYREYAFRAFEARVLDMETAAVAHVAHVNGTAFIGFRSLSDLAGGDPSANQFPVFIRLAAENSARTVRAFVAALPD